MVLDISPPECRSCHGHGVATVPVGVATVYPITLTAAAEVPAVDSEM
jgi:hypothetical protein